VILLEEVDLIRHARLYHDIGVVKAAINVMIGDENGDYFELSDEEIRDLFFVVDKLYVPLIPLRAVSPPSFVDQMIANDPSFVDMVRRYLPVNNPTSYGNGDQTITRADVFGNM